MKSIILDSLAVIFLVFPRCMFPVRVNRSCLPPTTIVVLQRELIRLGPFMGSRRAFVRFIVGSHLPSLVNRLVVNSF